MKKTKLFLCLICIFITCSCSAEINLKFDESFNISEESKISISKEFLKQYYHSNEEIKEYYENYLHENNVDDFELEVINEENNVVGILKKDYTQFTEIEKILFSKIEEENYTYKFIISENAKDLFQNSGMGVDQEALVDQIKINIQFSHNVLENNADSYNAKKNIYTWIITKENLGRNIEFTLTDEKRYDIIFGDFFDKYGVSLVLGLVVIIITIFSILLIQKIKKENEI